MSYDNIKIEKGMYMGSKGFSATLEELDPSENYIGSSLEGLDAYQRQLKRFGIKVSGASSDVIDKFFQTNESSALFPEYIARAVKTGVEEGSVVNKIVASVTNIQGLDYRNIVSSPEDIDKELTTVLEGCVIPETTISLQENTIKLKKRGRMLVASYEAIRYQHLDVFTVMLKQIGAYISRSQLKDAIDVLINGDGNENAAAAYTTAGTSIAYSDLVTQWNRMSPYEMNTIIASPEIMMAILNLSEFKDAAAGLNFHASGKMVTPLGADLIRGNDLSNKIISFDKNYAIEMLKAGDINIDYDKIIDRQLERAAITSTTGFCKLIDGASKVLTLANA